MPAGISAISVLDNVELITRLRREEDFVFDRSAESGVLSSDLRGELSCGLANIGETAPC